MRCTVSIRCAGLSVLAALATFAFRAAGAPPAPLEIRFSGMADASSGETLGRDWVVVANDEDNVLRVYRVPQGGAPVASCDLAPWMALAPKSPEMDLEGSARIGDVYYWITSHAPNREGKPRPNRKRLFALRITLRDGAPAFEPVGKPVATLLADLGRDPRYAPLRLEEAALRPPKTAGSLNIESLCDAPDGTLLIGFRSPTPEGRALLAPLENPADYLSGRAPRFGAPLLLDLGGNGLRAMIRTTGGDYLLMSGSPEAGGTPRLYRWSGRPDAQPAPAALALPPDATPEGLVELSASPGPALLVLSDDGTRPVDGVPAKRLADPATRVFRGFLLPSLP